MNLYKKLTVMLLCFSMAYPLCMAMDSDQETIETKALREHHENALLALKLLPPLNLESSKQNASSYLNLITNDSQLALEAAQA
ncbi:MAG: hypothetical protein ACOH2E_07790 [Candidatus Paracaedibacter sp.]